MESLIYTKGMTRFHEMYMLGCGVSMFVMYVYVCVRSWSLLYYVVKSLCGLRTVDMENLSFIIFFKAECEAEVSYLVVALLLKK